MTRILFQILITCILTTTFFSSAGAWQTIVIRPLSTEPLLNGDGSDWGETESVTIPLKSIKDTEPAIGSVNLKGGVFGDSVYFFIQWNDQTKDIVHKPFVWDDKRNKYVRGPQREDRFAMQFEMEGDYTTDWFSGNEFKADMWHWKAFRSNSTGIVHDKMTIISKTKMLRSALAKDRTGKPIYIYRPGDMGDKIYTTKRYRKKQQEIMPKYILHPNAKGSVADIKVKGVWKDSMWSLEMKRKLDTGHPDDVVFVPGQELKGGIAVFDHSENDVHSISEILLFRFDI